MYKREVKRWWSSLLVRILHDWRSQRFVYDVLPTFSNSLESYKCTFILFHDNVHQSEHCQSCYSYCLVYFFMLMSLSLGAETNLFPWRRHFFYQCWTSFLIHTIVFGVGSFLSLVVEMSRAWEFYMMGKSNSMKNANMIGWTIRSWICAIKQTKSNSELRRRRCVRTN